MRQSKNYKVILNNKKHNNLVHEQAQYLAHQPLKNQFNKFVVKFIYSEKATFFF